MRLSNVSLRLRADLLLVSIAIIWGSAFAAQRVAAQSGAGAFWFNGVRFFLACLVLMPFASRVSRPSRRDWWWIAAVGAIIFTASALQQYGMQYTTAGNAGFITGLYVVFVPLLLAATGRERPDLRTWLAVILAAVGIYLLSANGPFRLNPGDGIELVGAVFWALHVLLLGWLARRMPVASLSAGQFFICALLNLGAGLLWDKESAVYLPNVVWPVIYTGLFSIGAGYTLQALAQRYAPPTDAAIILSTESVFAALAGFLFLGERLAAWQLVGCGLIFGAILLATFGPGTHMTATPSPE